MSRLEDTLRKLDNSTNNFQRVLIESGEQKDNENHILREEILRLESVISGLIKVIGERLYERKK